jgi:endonuclease/exonuclease/phosphatase family metal-dependent hydrolase
MLIKIISFNIWGLPLWFVRDRAKRLAGLIKYLKKLDADIVCLQEVFDPKDRLKLIKDLGDVYKTTNDITNHRRILGLKLFDKSGGLVILSKWPILDSTFVPHNRLANSTIGEVFGRKGFLRATIKTPLGKLEVINIHLHEEGVWFADRVIRRNQLFRILTQASGKENVSILAGDFNQGDLLKRSEFMSLLEYKGFKHASEGLELEPSYRLENPYYNGLFNVPYSERLDYIFVRQLAMLKLKVASYQAKILEPSLSDHDPVILTLESN